jgi:cytochrome c oxidase cbb3-type subunit 4
MNFDTLLDNASSIMTLVSFLTFLGILAWTYNKRRTADFDEAALLPFTEEENPHV